jgi:hypothetical protein
MRSFALAAILLTLGIAALVLIGLTAVGGPLYSEAAVREFDTVYRVLGWAKYPAALLLLWMGNREVMRREYVGWHRTVLLWSPLLLFCFWCYLQWVTLGDARMNYLQDTGHWDGGFSAAIFQAFIVWPIAFVVTAINWGRLRRREMRLTTR